MAEETKEGFLSRWSRLKHQAEQGTPSVPEKRPDDQTAPDLPPVENLNFDSDYSGFLHPKVDDKLRRMALRKLFSDPHFNRMDGLDVYIEDYSLPSPISEELIQKLAHAAGILGAGAQGEAQAVAGSGSPSAAPENGQGRFENEETGEEKASTQK